MPDHALNNNGQACKCLLMKAAISAMYMRDFVIPAFFKIISLIALAPMTLWHSEKKYVFFLSQFYFAFACYTIYFAVTTPYTLIAKQTSGILNVRSITFLTYHNIVFQHFISIPVKDKMNIASKLPEPNALASVK